jgi:multiple RNA-binding domain-containing protein 1
LSGKRKAPERTAEDPDEGLQKRKRRADDERPDPKLEEFLQVMGRGQESLMGAVTSTGEEAPDSEAHQVPVPEAESDDEYEAIPSRKGKEVSRAQPEKAVNPPSRVQAVTAKNKEAESTHEPERSEPETMVVDDEATAGPAPKASAVANDDDWLRSRTNRLLDLMDPDDLPQERIDTREASVPEPTPDDRPKQKETANETGEGVTTTDLEHTATETEAAVPDSLDLIRRTSRLFVRNLPYGATEDDIRECFEKFGAIEEVCDISFGDVVTLTPSCGDALYLPSPSLWLHDETQIGTAYTSVYDEILGENFSRCFDCLTLRQIIASIIMLA